MRGTDAIDVVVKALVVIGSRQVDVAGLAAKPGVAEIQTSGISSAFAVQAGEVTHQLVSQARGVHAGSQTAVAHGHGPTQTLKVTALRFEDSHLQLITQAQRAVHTQVGHRALSASGMRTRVVKTDITLEGRTVGHTQQQVSLTGLITFGEVASHVQTRNVIKQQQSTVNALHVNRLVWGLRGLDHGLNHCRINPALTSLNQHLAESGFDNLEFDNTVLDSLLGQTDPHQPASFAVSVGHKVCDLLELIEVVLLALVRGDDVSELFGTQPGIALKHKTADRDGGRTFACGAEGSGRFDSRLLTLRRRCVQVLLDLSLNGARVGRGLRPGACAPDRHQQGCGEPGFLVCMHRVAPHLELVVRHDRKSHLSTPTTTNKINKYKNIFQRNSIFALFTSA